MLGTTFCRSWLHLENKALKQGDKVEVFFLEISLQALTGPEGSRSLRLPDFKTIGT
jgi:hypothetical protein